MCLSNRCICYILAIYWSTSNFRDWNLLTESRPDFGLFVHKQRSSTRFYLKWLLHESNLKCHLTLPKIYPRRQLHQISESIGLNRLEFRDKLRFSSFFFAYQHHLLDKFRLINNLMSNLAKSLDYRQRKYYPLKLLHFQGFPWLYKGHRGSSIRSTVKSF